MPPAAPAPFTIEQYRAAIAEYAALGPDQVSQPLDTLLFYGERTQQLMRDVGAPSGVRELGYDDGDVEALVEGAVKQQRLLVVSPREPSEDDLAEIIRGSMENWAPTVAAGSPASER